MTHPPLWVAAALSLLFAAPALSQTSTTTQRLQATTTPALTATRINRGSTGSAHHMHDHRPPALFSGRLPTINMQALPLADLPYQAQDLAKGGRIFRGKATHSKPGDTWQQYAYDLGVARADGDGKWWDYRPGINWKAPKNSDYYIFGVPIRAMTDGIVTHCWRNAPQNPRPFTSELDPTTPNLPLKDQTWLHKDTRAGKVFGSGNFVVIQEDAGTVIHYAHGQPGTVPKRLCPHEGKFLSPGNWMVDAAVPPAQQVRVKRGDILMLTGNSGTSSAPHIHVERTEGDLLTSVPLVFRSGLSSKLKGWPPAERTSNTWTKIAGKSLPAGRVLIWPARGPGGLWSWHKQRPAGFNDAFLHMADSGYIPRWLDLYRANGRTYVATVWTPAKAAWEAHTGLTAGAFQTAFDTATGKGLRPIRMDSHTTANGIRYSAVFSKDGPGTYVARHGQSEAAFDAEFKTLPAQGFVLTSASVVSKGSQRRYTVLWQKVNAGGWVFLPWIRGRDYQRVYDEQARAKRYPQTFSAYRHNGHTYYAVVFTSKPGPGFKARHGLSDSAYQAEFNAAGNRAIQAVAGVDGHDKRRYIALWR